MLVRAKGTSKRMGSSSPTAMTSTSSFRFELPTRRVKVNSAFVERRSIVDGGWWRLLNEADAQYYFGPHLRADATNFPHLAWLASQERDRTRSLPFPRGGNVRHPSPCIEWMTDTRMTLRVSLIVTSADPEISISREIAERFFTLHTSATPGNNTTLSILTLNL